MDIVAQAAAIAAQAHSCQLDKQGFPYIYHPARVADAVRLAGGSLEAQAAAWLHDVLEDTNYDVEYMASYDIPVSVTDAVNLLTHYPGVPNVEYWEKLKRDPIARMVKIHDMLDNRRPERMTVTPQQSQADIDRREAKYARGLRFMQGPWATVAEMEA